MDIYDLMAYREAEEKATSAGFSAFHRWWLYEVGDDGIRLRLSVRRVLRGRVPTATYFLGVDTVYELLNKLARQG